jgi:hypothetical protein
MRSRATPGLNRQMCTWRTQATVPGSPADVLELLTEPDAIARWAPIPFEILELEGPRLLTGSHARIAGRLAGRPVEFEVLVLDARSERLDLVADGPISIAVEYRLRPAVGGSDVQALSVEGRGLFGRVLAKATETLLAAGALRGSLERLGRELEPALAA